MQYKVVDTKKTIEELLSGVVNYSDVYIIDLENGAVMNSLQISLADIYNESIILLRKYEDDLCIACGGFGFINGFVGVNSGKSYMCDLCGGTGKVIK